MAFYDRLASGLFGSATFAPCASPATRAVQATPRATRGPARLGRLALLGSASVLAIACGSSSEEPTRADDDFTSTAGAPLELRFKGEVVADAADIPRKAIAAQLQYMQGALTTDAAANGQTGMPGLTNVSETVEGDHKRIAYEASIAVTWPKSATPPTSYDVVLPRDVRALGSFNEKYDGRCGKNEYGTESFWHDWNPKAKGCTTDPADVVRASASVAPHPQTTSGKYPEYDQVWKDDALDVVAVFGIIGENTPEDEGARTREKLLAEVSASLEGATRTEGPETDGIIKDSTVSGSIVVDGRERRVNVTGILVMEASSAGPAFEARYAAATEKADLVVYEGHSGLGKNIATLARNTGAQVGKYQLVYLYGCQTLAYLDPVMHDKRIELNGRERDPEGTKFLDIIATALPAYGDDGRSTIGLYRTMLDTKSPKTFEQIISPISGLHLVTVFGEHDNTFKR